MKLREAILDPPQDIAIGIAQIIVHWSFQIWLLQQVTYALLGVSMKQGRVAVRDPRPEDYVPMIQELMDLAGFHTSINLDGLRENLRQLKTLRDTIAHGVWMKGDDGNILLQFVSGTWKPNPKAKKTSRKVTPEGRRVTAASLETIRVAILENLKVTQKLFSEIEAQAVALHGRSPQRSA